MKKGLIKISRIRELTVSPNPNKDKRSVPQMSTNSWPIRRTVKVFFGCDVTRYPSKNLRDIGVPIKAVSLILKK